jgi:hypothetical protein
MVKRYFEHMHTKSTHERRQHAMRVASVVTAVVFLGWLGTLGVRLGSGTSSSIAVENNQAQQTQLANVIDGTYTPTGNTLEVATTTQQ